MGAGGEDASRVSSSGSGGATACSIRLFLDRNNIRRVC